MKKWLMILLALCLFCSAAAAEVSVDVKVVNARNLTLNAAANTFVIRTDSKQYQVVDSELNPLSAEYPQIDVRDGQYKVSNQDGACGLLDGQGKELIAPAYDDIQVISERWAAGITLKESTAENYDYETWFSEVKKFFLIDTVDIFYCGEKKGTLTRLDWNYAYAYGDYLVIQSREKKYSAYNKDFVQSPFELEYSSEYSENYRTGKVIHAGSGQEAFTPGCTLMPDEVQQYIWINQNDMLIDLQGNELADLSDYQNGHNVDKESNLIRVKNNKKKVGVLDATGKVIVPCEYDELDYSLASAQKMGYIYAVKDGKAGFVNLKNGKEAGFEFLESAGRQKSAFIVIEDPREGVILISAAAGELPGRYKEADVPYSSAAMFATVQEMDGRVHVIDAKGNDPLTDAPEIRSTYNVSYSRDGSIILVQDLEGAYHIYKVTYTEDPEENQDEGNKESGETAETWTCENGHEGNTGKFCGECGAAKPSNEEDGTWTCENGHEGNTGKFCTECGATKPQD